MTTIFRFISKQLLQRSCSVSKPAERFDLIVSRTVVHNLLRSDGNELPFEIMRPPMYAVFNATDGFFASPDQFTDDQADKFIAEFPKRYEKQGYYRTGAREKIDPKDVVLVKRKMDETPDDNWIAVTVNDLEDGELSEDWTTFELWLNHEWDQEHKHLLE